jgi:hypothetical protein
MFGWNRNVNLGHYSGQSSSGMGWDWSENLLENVVFAIIIY